MVTTEPLSLLELNWLPALYAHPTRWGTLLPLRQAGAARGRRSVLRLSATLIDGQQLRTRSAAQAPGWSLLDATAFAALARRLGQVMLAERVRQALDRRAVLACVELLGPRAREQAYDDARQWPALAPLVGMAEPWPADAEALAALGGGVMAALLESERSGQRERLLLRFAPGAAAARPLEPAAHAQATRFLDTEAA